MKKYKDLGIYDFSDYTEEITGDDLFKGSGGPSGGNNPGGPSGPSGPSAPDIPDEIKANPDAYNYYMSLQGKAKEEGVPDKYKGYNVLGAGKIPRQQEIKDNKLTEYDVTIGWKITVSEDPYYLSLPEATRKKVEELHPQIRNYAKFVLRDLNKQGIDVVVTSG